MMSDDPIKVLTLDYNIYTALGLEAPTKLIEYVAQLLASSKATEDDFSLPSEDLLQEIESKWNLTPEELALNLRRFHLRNILIHFGRYLENAGLTRELLKPIFNLAGALYDLDNGIYNPLFQTIRTTSPVLPTAEVGMQVLAVVAYDLFCMSGMSSSEASDKVASKLHQAGHRP